MFPKSKKNMSLKERQHTLTVWFETTTTKTKWTMLVYVYFFFIWHISDENFTLEYRHQFNTSEWQLKEAKWKINAENYGRFWLCGGNLWFLSCLRAATHRIRCFSCNQFLLHLFSSLFFSYSICSADIFYSCVHFLVSCIQWRWRKKSSCILSVLFFRMA